MLTCERFLMSLTICLSLPPLGGGVSYEALYRGGIVDKRREVDKGRRHRNRRYAHDGDLLGIVGSGPAFLPSPSFPHLGTTWVLSPLYSADQAKKHQCGAAINRDDQSFALQFSVENLQEIMFRWWQKFPCVDNIMPLWLVSGELVPAVCLLSAKCMCCAMTLV